MITIHAEGRAQPQKGPKKTFGLISIQRQTASVKNGGKKKLN